jgi:hypothetical protein
MGDSWDAGSKRACRFVHRVARPRRGEAGGPTKRQAARLGGEPGKSATPPIREYQIFRLRTVFRQFGSTYLDLGIAPVGNE